MQFNSVSLSLLLLLSFSMTFQGCTSDEKRNEHYSFYAAGHAYGNPIEYQYGIYPPLAAFFPYLNQKTNIAFGVFTGDVVPKNTPEYWDRAQADINNLEKPIIIAPGNHDRGVEFDQRFRTDTVFGYQNDQFVVLDTDNWMLTSDQIEMIKEASAFLKKGGNLFIFSHELVWWAPDNEFSEIEINYRPHYPGQTNFKTEILPFLSALPNDVYWIAGDIGCKPECTPYVLNQKGNVRLVASGVGGGINDNVLIFDVSEFGKVSINAIIFNELGRPFKSHTLQEL